MTEEENKTTEETQELSIVKSAYDAAEKLKAENLRMEENIKKLQELKSIEILGGKTDSGVQPEAPKEESPQEYAKKVLSGTI